MGKNNNDPMAMAAMLNNNQWMNNPFIYLVFLMMFGRNGLWGNNANGVQNAEIQGQLNAIRNQMSDNQNSNLLMDVVKYSIAVKRLLLPDLAEFIKDGL